MSTGKFITLEGPDGSGKTTQARLLSEFLESIGKDVVKTREPGGVSIAEKIRSILLEKDNVIYPRTELMLYASARAQHTSELIQPALERGKYVVCERFTHASVAYQGYGRELDIELIKQLNDIATGGLQPDITIYIDLDVEEGLRRVRQSDRELDRLESEHIEFHQRVREGYLKMAESDERMIVVKSQSTAELTADLIAESVKSRGII